MIKKVVSKPLNGTTFASDLKKEDKTMRNMKQSLRILITACMAIATAQASAQTVLTLEECRSMALENNSQSKIAREKVAAA